MQYLHAWSVLLGSVRLFCLTKGYTLSGIRGFTVLNMHASKGAFPWVGCKGSDSIILLKWLLFYVRLQLMNSHWSDMDSQVLKWMLEGCKFGLAFSQGIFGHGIFLRPKCSRNLRDAVQHFGNSYVLLADHCLRRGFNLFSLVPKLHSYMHICADLTDALSESRLAINPATYDCSVSEDFIGRIARHSRRISFRYIESGILNAWKVKMKFVINRFNKNNMASTKLSCSS